MNQLQYCYKYPRPAVTTDCVVFKSREDSYEVVLIRRKSEPFKGYWALPGGFIEMSETAEECVKRELFEETGIKNIKPEQLYTFTNVDRDPRGRTISISFIAFTDSDNITAGDDADEVRWFSLKNLPPLAFDHELILRMAVNRISEKS